MAVASASPARGREEEPTNAMKDAALQVPDKVRRKAVSLGEAGVAWLAELDGLVRGLPPVMTWPPEQFDQ
jgi:hypothetical protein